MRQAPRRRGNPSTTKIPGAKVFMADYEDANLPNSPTRRTRSTGIATVSDAIDRTIQLETDENVYELNEAVTTLPVRPWGLASPQAPVRRGPHADLGSLSDLPSTRDTETAPARSLRPATLCRSRPRSQGITTLKRSVTRLVQAIDAPPQPL